MEHFLLDTHALLWTLTEPRKLSEHARAALEDAQNDVFVSPVSVWEITGKRALGKLRAPDNLEASIKEQGFTPLSLTSYHAEQAGALPPHHGDPVRPDAGRPGPSRRTDSRHQRRPYPALRRPHYDGISGDDINSLETVVAA